jgi:hypothetical protein
MFTLLRRIGSVALIAFFISSISAAGASNPKYLPTTVPLSHDNAYFRNPAHPAPDFWALFPFYVPQSNEYDCSVASIAAVVNALTRANRNLLDSDRNVTSTLLLANVKVAQWGERMIKGGVNGQVGLTLDQLAEVLEEALKQNGIRSPRIEKLQVTSDDQATRDLWRKALRENEVSSDDMILIHFTQDTLTGAGGGPYPHISPIATFDAATGRALVMDVDREYYEPYWADAGLIVKAMAVRTQMYGHGGWIRVRR